MSNCIPIPFLFPLGTHKQRLIQGKASCWYFNGSLTIIKATTTLLDAAQAAPEDDREEFEKLVRSLECERRKVQDLLQEGKLWKGLLEEVAADRDRKRLLDAFFDYCKRESDGSIAFPILPLHVHSRWVIRGHQIASPWLSCLRLVFVASVVVIVVLGGCMTLLMAPRNQGHHRRRRRL